MLYYTVTIGETPFSWILIFIPPLYKSLVCKKKKELSGTLEHSILFMTQTPAPTFFLSGITHSCQSHLHLLSSHRDMFPRCLHVTYLPVVPGIRLVQGRGCSLLPRRVGSAGTCSEGPVQGRHVGDLQQPGLSG